MQKENTYYKKINSSRKEMFRSTNGNLNFLLGKRYSWIKEFINKEDKGLELGSGAGQSKIFLKYYNFITSDIRELQWLDKSGVDAHNTPFEDNSFDYIFIVNLLHHLDKPFFFFKEADRLLKPNGMLIIFEPYASSFFRWALKLTRHEHCNDRAQIFNPDYSFLSESKDFWDGNNSVAQLIFDNPKRFLNAYKQFEIIHHSYAEFILFLNSGGVYTNNVYIPLNKFFLRAVEKTDNCFIKMSPRIFALATRIVLKKV